MSSSAYRMLYWPEVAQILDQETVDRYGAYLSTLLRNQHDPLSIADIPPDVSPSITLAVKVSAADWIRYYTDFACTEPAANALCWLLRYTPQHPAFVYMPIDREYIASTLHHVAHSVYSWRFFPSAIYGVVLVGINKYRMNPYNPYEFESYEFDPEDLVAPKKALSSFAGDRALTLRLCLLSVFEKAFHAVCLVKDRPNVRVSSYHADAIHKTVRRLLSVVDSLPQQPAV
jgi:hypothetical protein